MSARADRDVDHALADCTEVAFGELVFAEKAVAQAAAHVNALRLAVANASVSSPSDGASVDAARSSLRELRTRLDDLATRHTAAAYESLAARASRADQFTVTLFGRTMAGKSTIREAITRGDGSTIGRGGQRTTRRIHEYPWNSEQLRLVDTPGVGAFDGDHDATLAFSAVEHADVLLFLVSSDGIQEDVFKAMRYVRDLNKPTIFVLNVKRNLDKPVLLRRFLADPSTVFGERQLAGHRARIRTLAIEFLGMQNPRIVPVHAQAAFLSTRPEHRACAAALEQHCRLGDLLDAIHDEILQCGSVRRLQSIVDGTRISIADLRDELAVHADAIERMARHLMSKQADLDRWFEQFGHDARSGTKTHIALLLQPLRDEIDPFLVENLTREDVGQRWKECVDRIALKQELAQHARSILDTLRSRLIELTRELRIESDLLGMPDFAAPPGYSPSNTKKWLGWVSAGAGAVSLAAETAAIITGAAVFPPLALAFAAVGLISFGLSWFAKDRGTKLRDKRAEAGRQLRDQVNRLELGHVEEALHWFDNKVEGVVIANVRREVTHLCDTMRDIVGRLRAARADLDATIHDLDRRLLVQTSHLLGRPFGESDLDSVVRDPGHGCKFLWRRAPMNGFAEAASSILGETVVGVRSGTLREVVSRALAPAAISPAMVRIEVDLARVIAPHSQAERARGRDGRNVALARQLAGVEIKIETEAAT